MTLEQINKNSYASMGAVAHYSQRKNMRREEEAVFKWLNAHLELNSILDLGCGAGRTTGLIKRTGRQIVGLDLSLPLVNAASKNIKHVTFLQADAAHLPFSSAIFSVVLFSFNGLDYLFPQKNRVLALKEIIRVLRPGGYFIFSSHNSEFVPNNLARLHAYIASWWKGRQSHYWWNIQSFGPLLEYHSSISEQISELGAIGFTDIQVVSLYNPLVRFRDPHPYYFCRKT